MASHLPCGASRRTNAPDPTVVMLLAPSQALAAWPALLTTTKPAAQAGGLFVVSGHGGKQPLEAWYPSGAELIS